MASTSLVIPSSLLTRHPRAAPPQEDMSRVPEVVKAREQDEMLYKGNVKARLCSCAQLRCPGGRHVCHTLRRCSPPRPWLTVCCRPFRSFLRVCVRRGTQCRIANEVLQGFGSLKNKYKTISVRPPPQPHALLSVQSPRALISVLLI